MTVAIGLVCKDGVVVASDSMSSAGAIAHQGQKVKAVEDLRLVWTASGSVYIIEEVEVAMVALGKEAESEAAIRETFQEPKLQLARQNIAEHARKSMDKAYKSALSGVAPIPLAGGGTRHPWHSDFLFAGYANKTPYLLEVAGDGQLNWHTTHGFSSVGSGGPFAEVARGLMEHYVQGSEIPVALGLWVAFRTIDTTCRVSTQFVGLPVQLAVVDDSGARVLSQDEVDEVDEGVQGWLVEEKDTLRQPGEAPEALEEPPTLDAEPSGEPDTPTT